MKESKNLQINYYHPSLLVANPWNPNKVDAENQKKITTSLKNKGFFKPVLVRQVGDDMQIIGGEHRVKAASDLGMDVPVVNLGEISDAEAKLFGQADNARYGADDEDLLSELFKSGGMGSIDEIMSILPIDEDELEGFVKNVTADSDQALLDQLDDLAEGDTIDLDIPSSPTKTHQILRFKVPMKDFDAIDQRITQVRTQQGFNDSDDLTNAGDALVYLLQEVDAHE